MCLVCPHVAPGGPQLGFRVSSQGFLAWARVWSTLGVVATWGLRSLPAEYCCVPWTHVHVWCGSRSICIACTCCGGGPLSPGAPGPVPQGQLPCLPRLCLAVHVYSLHVFMLFRLICTCWMCVSLLDPAAGPASPPWACPGLSREPAVGSWLVLACTAHFHQVCTSILSPSL